MLVYLLSLFLVWIFKLVLWYIVTLLVLLVGILCDGWWLSDDVFSALCIMIVPLCLRLPVVPVVVLALWLRSGVCVVCLSRVADRSCLDKCVRVCFPLLRVWWWSRWCWALLVFWACFKEFV